MCLRCDGYSEQDVLRNIELTIATYGWYVQGVVNGPDERGPEWCYSIGLAENYGLPELAVIGPEYSVGVHLVNAAAECLLDGYTLDDMAAELGGRHGVVHQSHIDSGDWFGTWSTYHGHLPEPGLFVQVFAPSGMFCACHRHLIPDLTVVPDRPDTRAARRRAERERRRRR